MTSGFIRLENEGVGVIVDARGAGLPRVLHWGAPVGRITDADAEALAHALSRQTSPGSLDAAWQLSLSPQEGDGWSGRPGMQLRRDGVLHHARWSVDGIDADDAALTGQGAG